MSHALSTHVHAKLNAGQVQSDLNDTIDRIFLFRRKWRTRYTSRASREVLLEGGVLFATSMSRMRRADIYIILNGTIGQHWLGFLLSVLVEVEKLGSAVWSIAWLASFSQPAGGDVPAV